MKNKGINGFNWQVMFLLLVYVFITATHILLLAPHGGGDYSVKITHAAVVKNNAVASAIPVIFQIRRIDKCTIDEKTLSFAAVCFVLGNSFLLLILFFDALKRKKTLFAWDSYKFQNKQYAYLTLCTFRI
ncbi:hypothetical protein [Mucilaginibacter sp.]